MRNRATDPVRVLCWRDIVLPRIGYLGVPHVGGVEAPRLRVHAILVDGGQDALAILLMDVGLGQVAKGGADGTARSWEDQRRPARRFDDCHLIVD